MDENNSNPAPIDNSPPNVAISLEASPREKINQLYRLCRRLVPNEERSLDDELINWRAWFYVFLMWHESRNLKTRIQDPLRAGRSNGPGRGLMQFEPLTVWDIINRYVHGPKPGLMQRLANAVGVDLNTEMKPVLKAFRAAGNPVRSWPTSSPANKIEHWLLTNDAFGIELMQMYLALFSAPLPPLNASHQHQNPRAAKYHGEFAAVWADRWWKGNIADRPARIARFLTNAAALDTAAR